MVAEMHNVDKIRLQASKRGWRLWRNNVGAGVLKTGGFIRWGLANESAAMNNAVKSSDLIGIRPILITQEHVGKVIGQFVAIEVKHSMWKFNKKDNREKAQKVFLDLINKLGGYAIFSTGLDDENN